jgi:hypothetical protein
MHFDYYATFDKLRKSLANLTEAIQLLGGEPTANMRCGIG